MAHAALPAGEGTEGRGALTKCIIKARRILGFLPQNELEINSKIRLYKGDHDAERPE